MTGAALGIDADTPVWLGDDAKAPEPDWWVGELAKGENDAVGANDCRSLRRSEAHPMNLERTFTFEWDVLEQESGSLLAGQFDLLGRGAQALLRAAIGDAYLCPQAQCGTGAVHRRITAADNQYPLAGQ